MAIATQYDRPADLQVEPSSYQISNLLGYAPAQTHV